MKKRLLVITILLGLLMCIACPAGAKIVPTPASVTLGSREIGFVSIACDGKTVTLVLSGFDGRIRIKNNKQVFTYQANIVVDGKTVKWKTGATEGDNYTFTYKAKTLPDTITVFRIEDALTGPYLSQDIVLTDDAYLPVAASVELGGSISAEHGIGRMHVERLERFKPALDLEMMRRVKQAFDPAGLMNPGKILRG